MPTAVIIPLTAVPQTNEQRWRAQQKDRQVFESRRVYTATEPTPLFWYDPLTGQSLTIGTLLGDFTAQAQFEFIPRGNQAALEVPYRINSDFGLTAISPAVRDRMIASNYTESVEAYVFISDPIRLKQ